MSPSPWRARIRSRPIARSPTRQHPRKALILTIDTGRPTKAKPCNDRFQISLNQSVAGASQPRSPPPCCRTRNCARRRRQSDRRRAIDMCRYGPRTEPEPAGPPVVVPRHRIAPAAFHVSSFLLFPPLAPLARGRAQARTRNVPQKLSARIRFQCIILEISLVSRFRSSHHFAGTSFASFGIEGTLVNHCF
jgi:hypothetical protein